MGCLLSRFLLCDSFVCGVALPMDTNLGDIRGVLVYIADPYEFDLSWRYVGDILPTRNSRLRYVKNVKYCNSYSA